MSSLPLSQQSFSVGLISLNQLKIQYIQCCSSIDISATVLENHLYRFTVHAPGYTNLTLEGQCALLTHATELFSQHLPIRAVIVSFDTKKLKETLKKRYGKHYQVIPWIPIIPQYADHKLLLHSLTLWLIQQALEVKQSEDDDSWLPIENALLELFVDNLDRRALTRPEDFEVKRNWFTELEKWMEQNLGETISLDDLALVAGVSVRSIQKAFRQYRQCTPMDALLQKRLEKARDMLSMPTESATVLDVAMELGYMHPSRFAKQYKNKFGENPSETLSKARKQ